MINFFYFPYFYLYTFLFFSIVLVSLQAFHISLIFCSHIKKRACLIVPEFFLLIHCAILASWVGSIIINRRSGVITNENYETLAFIFGLLTIIAFSIIFSKNKINYGCVIFAQLLSIPLISKLGQNAYSIGYSFFLSILLIRTVLSLIEKVSLRKKSLTVLSIRDGLDNLDTGVMFYDVEGYIYLSNSKMVDTMHQFFNKEFKNGNEFWNAVVSEGILSAKRYTIKKDVVFRTKNATWRFTQKTFRIENKMYTELIASDVTEIDNNLLQLERNEKKLRQQEKEILILSENIIQLKKEQEFARMRSQVHDVMGQRLTAVQRLLKTEVDTTYNSIIPLLQNMVENIKEEYKPNFQQNFFELKKYFEQIGIQLCETGDIPQNEEIAHIFLSVIREATTNAIRHAQATIVSVHFSHNETSWKMHISDNGRSDKESINEGGGILGIRERVNSVGGTTTITHKPIFTITITIEKNNVSSC